MAGNRFKPTDILADEDFDTGSGFPSGNVTAIGLLLAQSGTGDQFLANPTDGPFQGNADLIINQGNTGGLDFEEWLIQDADLLYNGMRYRSNFEFSPLPDTNTDFANEDVEFKCGDMLLKFETGTSQSGNIKVSITPVSDPAKVVILSDAPNALALDREGGIISIDMGYHAQGTQMECTVSQGRKRKKAKITGYTPPIITARAVDEIFWKVQLSTAGGESSRIALHDVTIEVVQVGQAA